MYIFFISGHPTRGTFPHINEALQLMKKYVLSEIKAVMFMEKKSYMLKHNPSLKTSSSSSFKS